MRKRKSIYKMKSRKTCVCSRAKITFEGIDERIQMGEKVECMRTSVKSLSLIVLCSCCLLLFGSGLRVDWNAPGQIRFRAISGSPRRCLLFGAHGRRGPNLTFSGYVSSTSPLSAVADTVLLPWDIYYESDRVCPPTPKSGTSTGQTTEQHRAIAKRSNPLSGHS